LNGKTVAVAEPVYPAEAKAAKAFGAVEVEINVDNMGTVTSAKATRGHRTLRATSETAAMLSKFAPLIANGRAVRFTGKLIYRFRTVDKVEVFVKNMKALPLSAADRKLALLGEKLHFWVFAVADRVANSKPPAANEYLFVKDGKAAVRIVLKTISAETLEKLKAIGFEPTSSKNGVNIDGLLPVDKIAEAAALDQVKLILPRT